MTDQPQHHCPNCGAELDRVYDTTVTDAWIEDIQKWVRISGRSKKDMHVFCVDCGYREKANLKTVWD